MRVFHFSVKQFGKRVILFQYLFVECQDALYFAIAGEGRIFRFHDLPGLAYEVGFGRVAAAEIGVRKHGDPRFDIELLCFLGYQQGDLRQFFGGRV